MTVLVVGGAGYIGSHMVAVLKQHAVPCVVLDNLTTGFREAVPADIAFVEGDLADLQLMADLFKQHGITSVMHFAAYSQVGESMQDPAKYYHNNLAKTLALLDAMCAANIKEFVFSSTAAVYGNPLVDKISEQHPVTPINPYGHSKLAVEMALADYANAYGMKAVSLRYFNAAGAQPDASNGERHEPETHLIPLVLQAASGRRQSISLFGDDYNTSDGSCVRDYIHILDLAQAHLLALKWLQRQTDSVFRAFNLGNGEGYSVKQVIDVARQITGLPIQVEQAPRRQGDPAVLVASADDAKQQLNWQPQFDDLASIIKHAWQWEQQYGHRWGS